jgi:hypothetical protein
VSGDIAVFAANVNDMTIEGNQIDSPYGATILTMAPGNVSNLNFVRNVVAQMNTIAPAGLSGAVTVTNLNFSDNIFKLLNQPIGVYFPSTAILVRCRFDGTVFYDTAATPFAFSGATAGTDSVVSNNIAKGSNLGGSVVTSVGNAF